MNAIKENLKVSTKGLILKSSLGVTIVFAIAMPNILAGNIMFEGIVGMISLILLGIVWRVLFNSLKRDRGEIVNLILYMLSCVMLGLFFSQAISVTIYYVGIYSDGAVDSEMIYQALIMTSLATMIAVVGGIAILPKINLNGKFVKISSKFVTILSAISIGWMIIAGIGIILSTIGSTWLLDGLYSMFFGIGPISIVISLIMVFSAGFLFLASASVAKNMVDSEDKYMEYFASMILVNSIIQMFQEIFKLILQILASRD